MSIRHTVLALVAVALASPVAAQTIDGPNGIVIRGVPGGISVGVPGGISIGPIGPIGAIGPINIAGLDMALGPMRLAELDRFDAQDREGERQDREQERLDRERERAQANRDREMSLYEEGTNAIDEGRWDRAISNFSRLADLKGGRADSALYWKAYAQNRLGQRADALTTIAELTKGYPSSRYLKEARALDAEMRGAAGQPAAINSTDEDLKLLALNALANSDSEQAVPLIENILNGSTQSPRLKSRALFVLAQMNNARSREVLKNIAKGSSTPELQLRAIQYLGVQGSSENRAVLAEIYSSSTDVDMKRRILRAYMVAGDKSRLLTAAQGEPNADLRAEAVRQLGVMGANEELWTMYQKESTLEVKRQILSAMQVGGNVTRMIDIAKTEKDPELRRIAVRNLGIMGSKASGDALAQIYTTDKDPVIRKSVINSLFISNNAESLVGLARKEPDIAMKKEMVQKLSLMDNKVARDYMVELLK